MLVDMPSKGNLVKHCSPIHVLSSNLIAFSYDHYELGICRAAIALTDFQPTFEGKSHTIKMDSEHHDTHR
jgi:hypothetical protein